MKTKTSHAGQAGFTLIELSIYMLLVAVLSAVAFSFLLSGSTLATKNSNLNRSHEDLRLAFDRMAHQVASANNVATLIDTAGAAVTSPVVNITTPMVGTLTGPAAGFKFDQVVAEPYVLQAPGDTTNDPLAAGSIPSTATSINVFYPKFALTHAAHLTNTPAVATDVSAQGLILLISQPDGSYIRWQIAQVGVRDSSNAKWHKVPLTFSNQIGKQITWSAKQPQMVKIVRNEAFLVMDLKDASGNNVLDRNKNIIRELRYFKDFEPMPNLNDASKYVVLCNQIGVKDDEKTPFAILEINGDKIVQSTLRVRERDNTANGNVNQMGAGGESNANFYTYFQLLVNLPSRFRPRTNQ